jgi:tetratricopeptide (TPR) repeat protein
MKAYKISGNCKKYEKFKNHIIPFLLILLVLALPQFRVWAADTHPAVTSARDAINENMIYALSAFKSLLKGKKEIFLKGKSPDLDNISKTSEDARPWDLYEMGRNLIFSSSKSAKGAGILKSVTENYQDKTYTAALALLNTARYHGFLLMDRARAIQIIEQIEEFPANRVLDTAGFYKALFYLLDNRTDQALKDFEKTAKKISSPKDHKEIYHIYDDARYFTAWIKYSILNDTNTAQIDFNKLLNDYPGTPYKFAALYNLARIRFNKKDFATAENLFHRALDACESQNEKLMCRDYLSALKPENREIALNKAAFGLTLDTKYAFKQIHDFNKFCRGLASSEKNSFLQARDYISKNRESPFYTIALFLLAEKMRNANYTDQARKVYEKLYLKKRGFTCSDEAEYCSVWLDSRGDDILQQRLEIFREKNILSFIVPMAEFYSALITLEKMDTSLDIHIKRLKKNSLEFTQTASFFEGINYLAKGEPERAINSFDTCIQGYFQSPLTDDAQFLMAETYYNENLLNKKVSRSDLNKSILMFRKIIIDHHETEYKDICLQRISALESRKK